jgi:hypothetical protein
MRSDPLMRVGAGFGMNRYSSVSSAVMRVKTKLQKDRKFKDRLKHIENNILKDQTKTPISESVRGRLGNWPFYLDSFFFNTQEVGEALF